MGNRRYSPEEKGEAVKLAQEIGGKEAAVELQYQRIPCTHGWLKLGKVHFRQSPKPARSRKTNYQKSIGNSKKLVKFSCKREWIKMHEKKAY